MGEEAMALIWGLKTFMKEIVQQLEVNSLE